MTLQKIPAQITPIQTARSTFLLILFYLKIRKAVYITRMGTTRDKRKRKRGVILGKYTPPFFVNGYGNQSILVTLKLSMLTDTLFVLNVK